MGIVAIVQVNPYTAIIDENVLHFEVSLVYANALVRLSKPIGFIHVPVRRPRACQIQ